MSLRTAWHPPRDRWEIAAWVDNAGGKRFLPDAGSAGSDYGTPTFIASSPRRCNASVAARW